MTFEGPAQPEQFCDFHEGDSAREDKSLWLIPSRSVFTDHGVESPFSAFTVLIKAFQEQMPCRDLFSTVLARASCRRAFLALCSQGAVWTLQFVRGRLAQCLAVMCDAELCFAGGEAISFITYGTQTQF